MAGDFDAGSVWIQFKAAASGLANGFKQALGGLGTFESGANSAFTRIARYSRKLINVQFAVMQLTQVFGNDSSGLGQSIKFVAAGLSTFAITASVISGPVGLLMGAVLGLATAFAGLMTPSKEAQAEMDRQAKIIQERADSYRNLADDLEKIRKDFEVKGFIGKLLNEDIKGMQVEEMASKIARLKKELQNWTDTVAEHLKARQALSARAEALATPGVRTDAGTQQQINYLTAKAADEMKAAAQGSVKWLETEKKLNADIAILKQQQAEAGVRASALVMARVDAEAKVDAILESANAKLRAGASWIQDMVKATEQLLVKMTERDKQEKAFEARRKGVADFSREVNVQRALEDVQSVLLSPGQYLNELLAEGTRIAKEQARQAEMNAWAGTTGSMSVEDRMGIVEASLAAKEKIEALLKETRESFDDLFSGPFSHSIADGLRDGILAGADALSIVRNMGENMFRESISTLVEFGRKNLATALTDLLGAGGKLMGTLMSGIMGVAGYFLSGRARNGGSQTYASITGITSSEASRGIVAGPSSVAIAAVGDDLSRAFAPVVARLDSLISIGTQINSKVGGGGGGLAYAGAVPS